ncbi:hypothetical protein KJ611_02140 [Patescibacteria group bacterium]|nr:hypothetical protein [Patescibacteria group bacterium]
MWRMETYKKERDSEFLDGLMERIEMNQHLWQKAEALLSGVAKQEPLFADALRTPQSPHYHAEGPTLQHHLRLMLMVLYAVAEGKLSLLDIEEFRRMKEYEGEIKELEQTIRESAALFEAFILCHDAAKWASVFFSAPKGSRGEQLGFDMDLMFKWDEFGASERAKAREKYLLLFDDFVREHPGENEESIEAQFYLYYGIRVHYPGHERAIHTPVYRHLLERVGVAHGLSEQDRVLLEDLIGHHQIGEQFNEVRPEGIRKLMHFAQARGYDSDDFIDRLQAGVFLDMVSASKRLAPHGTWRDPSVLINFLRSEHEYQPGRRQEKLLRREAEAKREQNRLFREVGLDGVALMELFEMDPGPQFGKVMRKVHNAIAGKEEIPEWPNQKVANEMKTRVAQYYSRAFDQGGDGD